MKYKRYKYKVLSERTLKSGGRLQLLEEDSFFPSYILRLTFSRKHYDDLFISSHKDQMYDAFNQYVR